MTEAQDRKIERIKANFLRHSAHGSNDWEFKTVNVDDHSPLVFLYLVSGMTNDDGTPAAIYVRMRAHFAIGKKGGVKVLSMESGMTPVKKKHQHLYF